METEQLAILRRITTRITGGRDVREVLEAVTRAAVDVADVALARVWLYVPGTACALCGTGETKALHLAASAGLHTHINGEHHRIPLGHLEIGRIAETCEPLCTNDMFAGYPLIFRGELVGVLGMFSRHIWSTEEFSALEVFASEAATAIKVAQLFSDLERLNNRLAAENRYLREAESGFEDIIGESPAMRRVLEQVRQVGPTDSSVLLTGETGTGKELVARAIHAVSARHERALVRVDCRALSPDLGWFELADQSTLFLDEVGELPLDAQVKLLDVVRERRLDVRVVAATNREFATEVEAHRFRRDLFHQLNVFQIRLPPLRERREDIPLLVSHFLTKSFRGVSPRSMERLVRYDWPGNIRELQNVLERACMLARGPIVDVTDAIDLPAPESDNALLTLDDAERAAIRRALDAAGGIIAGPRGAAALLDVNPSTLRSRMASLGMR